LNEYHYVDTFRHLHPKEVKYSFWSVRANLRPENKGWRLDYFVVDQQHLGMVSESEIHTKVMGSDHCPISLKLNLSESKKPEKHEGKTEPALAEAGEELELSDEKVASKQKKSLERSKSVDLNLEQKSKKNLKRSKS
jgi:hypothetical protein